MQLLKQIILLLLLAGSFGISILVARSTPNNYAAVVVDADTGKILHKTNIHKQIPPASLTKVMTLAIIFDALEKNKIRLTDMWPVSKHAAAQSPCKLHLSPGSYISVQNVILSMVTQSANDAAAVTAEFFEKDEKTFARYMTKRARQFGMKDTTFKNASGLPAVGQLTTAHDMALLGLVMLKHYKKYFHLFSVKEFCFQNKCYRNHNLRLLNKNHVEFDGIKTGFVNKSGFVVLATNKNAVGHYLVTVVMGGPSHVWRDNRVVELVHNLRKNEKM